MVLNHQNTAEQRNVDQHAKGMQAGMDAHKHHSTQDFQRETAFNEREHEMKLHEMQQNLQQKLAEKSAQQKPKPQKGE